MTSKPNITLAIDAMGGDNGPGSVLPAVAAELAANLRLSVLLFGDRAELEPLLEGLPAKLAKRLQFQHCDQVVTMDEPPAAALRHKKQSSMFLALKAVADGEAQGCVSAGNTGALMAISRHVLKMLPDVDRPAIVSSIPAPHGHTWMLDLGANVRCDPQHLYDFAIMGAALAEVVDGCENPRIGLLNIGTEEIKGVYEVRECAAMLRESPLNYVGFVEGNDLFVDKVDVVVCDGFLGNVALKTMEGMAAMMIQLLRDQVERSIWTRLRGLFALPLIRRFGSSMDPRLYNGASLLGLRHVVVKSHGSADQVAFGNAIKIAIDEVAADLPLRIEKALQLSAE